MRGRQIGILFLNVLVLLFVNRAAPAYGQSRPAPGLTGACAGIRLSVRGDGAGPIPGASVVVNGRWHFSSDANGGVEIDCRRELKLPVDIEVSAAGFVTQSRVIRSSSGQDNEIILTRERIRREPSRSAVAVTELSSGVQERSARLQESGLKALRHGEYDAAGEFFRNALSLTPSSPAIYNNLGIACARKNQLMAAGSWLEAAFALAPFDAVIRGNLGLIRWLQGRLDESYALLKTAMGHGYSCGAAFYATGIMALQKGIPGEAVRYLSKASAVRFKRRDLFRSIALQELGDAGAALKSRRQFLRRNPVPLIPANYAQQ